MVAFPPFFLHKRTILYEIVITSALTSELSEFPFQPAPTIKTFVESGKTLIDLEYALGAFVLTCTQLPEAPRALFVNRLPLPAKLTRTVPELPPVELHVT
jgi:hypothetical protein